MQNLPTTATLRRLKKLSCGLALVAFTVLSLSAPVHADDRDWHGHREDAHRHWGDHRPGYVYAPPVVYSPPPESTGINLILPLHFR